MMSGVNTTLRRVILWILNALGAFVGVWALAAPQAFYEAFPGIGFGAWVGVDGPFNEHLIRDVGALYLALRRRRRGRGAHAPSGCLDRDRRRLAGVLRAALRIPPAASGRPPAARRDRRADLARRPARAQHPARDPSARPSRTRATMEPTGEGAR